MALTEDIIKEFNTNYVEVIKAKMADVPDDKHGHPQYIKMGQQVEFLQKMVAAMEKVRIDNMDFLAVAEQINFKINRYRIGEKDFLLPAQKEQLEWIKKITHKIKTDEEYKL